MILPNTFIIGTAKSGTSTLKTYLENHPDCGFASASEPNFFCFDKNFAKGLEFYSNYFAHCSDAKVICEKSWRYSVKEIYPKSRDRILSCVNQPKFLYVVRDPVERAKSFWLELRSNGYDRINPDFNRSIRQDKIMIETSLYYKNIAHYLKRIPKSSLFISFYEDMKASQQLFLDEICDFLNVSRFQINATIHENKSDGKRTDSALLEHFRDFAVVPKVRDIMPAWMRDIARQFLKKETPKPEFNNETLRWFREQIDDDTHKFLALAGRPREIWS